MNKVGTRLTEVTPDAGILSIELSGHWEAWELERLISGLKRSHNHLNTLEFFSRQVHRESGNKNTGHFTSIWSSIIGERLIIAEEPELIPHMMSLRSAMPPQPHPMGLVEGIQLLGSITERYTYPLQVGHLELLSPEVIQLIGSCNPLKVIAEAISNWRLQNTERDKNRQQFDLEQQKLRSQERMEMARLKSDLAKHIIDSSRELRDISDPINLERLLQIVDGDIREDVSNVARDIRINDVKFTLPPHE